MRKWIVGLLLVFSLTTLFAQEYALEEVWRYTHDRPITTCKIINQRPIVFLILDSLEAYLVFPENDSVYTFTTTTPKWGSIFYFGDTLITTYAIGDTAFARYILPSEEEILLGDFDKPIVSIIYNPFDRDTAEYLVSLANTLHDWDCDRHYFYGENHLTNGHSKVLFGCPYKITGVVKSRRKHFTLEYRDYTGDPWCNETDMMFGIFNDDSIEIYRTITLAYTSYGSWGYGTDIFDIISIDVWPIEKQVMHSWNREGGDDFRDWIRSGFFSLESYYYEGDVACFPEYLKTRAVYVDYCTYPKIGIIRGIAGFSSDTLDSTFTLYEYYPGVDTFEFIRKWNRPSQEIIDFTTYDFCGVSTLDTRCWYYKEIDDYTIVAKAFDGIHAGVKEESAKPSAFSLSAHPNPFNSAVKITIDAPVETQNLASIEIEIFDVNGRHIKTFRPSATSGTGPSGLEKGGTNSAPLHKGGQGGAYVWQPDESLGSGVYLVRATMGEETTSKRVVYLK